MISPQFQHSTLGTITPLMCEDLARLCAGKDSRRLQGEYSSSQVAVLRDIASLQTKAIRTFGPAEFAEGVWWANRTGLQQSTQAKVAKLKASWFGSRPVADICCGLGSDFIALVARGPVTGIDLDTDVLSFAEANLRTAYSSEDFPDAKLRARDVTEGQAKDVIGDADLVHVDPDRRADGKRHTRADDMIPDWQRVGELIAQCDGAAVKLAPATELASDFTSNFHRFWIATGGSVREQTLVCGDLLESEWMRDNRIRPGERSAVCIRNEEVSVFTSSDQERYASKSGVKEFLIDPDVSIRAAGLTESFTNTIGANLVDKASGFLSADTISGGVPFADMMTSARVLEVVGCDERKLKRCFRSRDAYPEVIKVRGGDIDPARLTKRLRDCGEQPLGLWIGRNGKRTFAAITEIAR